MLVAYLQQGGRLSALADAISVSDLWMLNPPDIVAVEDYFRLCLSASELLHDPLLGIKAGQNAGLENFDVLGEALTNLRAKSLTLGHALHHWQRRLSAPTSMMRLKAFFNSLRYS
jgi:hypothetical protein